MSFDWCLLLLPCPLAVGRMITQLLSPRQKGRSGGKGWRIYIWRQPTGHKGTTGPGGPAGDNSIGQLWGGVLLVTRVYLRRGGGGGLGVGGGPPGGGGGMDNNGWMLIYSLQITLFDVYSILFSEPIQ